MPEKQSYSVYIHIPFCKRKCYYCSFTSFVEHCFDFKKVYIDELKNEFTYNLDKINNNQNYSTIYIGGGTPSLLEIQDVESLLLTLAKYNEINPNTEITIEVNPETVNYTYLKKLREIGINRLSIGIQSFNDNELKLINRQHSSSQALECVLDAQKAGFNNISIDLIYGLPEQTMDSLLNSLNIALSLNIQHISTYGLKIEEGTYFFKNTPESIADEDYQADMYLNIIDFLDKNDFIQYEISNFAYNKNLSQHNLNYWKNNEYFGFGLGAHGYLNGKRYANTCDINKYLNQPDKKDSIVNLSEQEKIEEAIFLGLRLTEGLNLTEIKDRYDIDLLEKHDSIIKKHKNNNLIVIENNQLKLTKEGMLLSNYVLSDFID